MSPRETIARAIYEIFCEDELEKFDNRYGTFDDLTYPIRECYLLQADAVIDALSSMPPTDAMRDAYSDINGLALDAEAWRAMVGAMRDE